MDLRVPGVRRAAEVRFTFDGAPVVGHAGETVLAALQAAGVRRLREAPAGGARGAFCAMGLCQECLVEVGGARVEACRLVVEEGLAVDRVRYG
ncbi:MAG: (2Fe-2S)-binding protein [Pseudomonadota bacterium]